METGNTSKMWGWQEAGSQSKFCSSQFLLLELVNIHNITIFFYLLRPAISWILQRLRQWKSRFNHFIFIWMCGERKRRNACLLTSFINLNFPIPLSDTQSQLFWLLLKVKHQAYWPLIGCRRSRDPYTGFWLVHLVSGSCGRSMTS